MLLNLLNLSVDMIWGTSDNVRLASCPWGPVTAKIMSVGPTAAAGGSVTHTRKEGRKEGRKES